MSLLNKGFTNITKHIKYIDEVDQKSNHVIQGVQAYIEVEYGW